ncbi:MAG: hypothetical protein IJU61_01900 [Victivallales bacterium]|jgi:uncharacterized repeat protein (TIGR04138 family)|nr:hypothetical protein [Victivallales bacterium]
MTLEEQLDIIRKICEEDDSFPPMAYCFVRDSVHKALENIAKAKRELIFNDEEPPDIKGADLCRFFRDTLINRFGPCAIDVLDTWNIKKTSDFGKIVYKLISVEILGKSENDSVEDFDDVYDFTEEFVMPYKQGTMQGRK